MGREVTERIKEVQTDYTRTRQKMQVDMDEKRYPLQAEPALIHPSNTSVVKIRDNGMIDIFVGTDNGLRIDPNSRTVTAMANTSVAKQRYAKSRTDRDRESDVGGNDTQKVANHWTVNAGGNIRIAAEGDVNISSATCISMNAPVIDLTAGQEIRMTPFPAHSHPERG